MLTKDDFIVIPARRGSKGVPFKNRTLIEHTLKIIPSELSDRVYITTDDEVIQELYSDRYNVIERAPKYAQDITSTKDTLLNFFETIGKNSGTCILLYTVYPNRTWQDVIDFYKLYNQMGASSVLAKKEVIEPHPFLMMYDMGNNSGKQVIEHNLYRRQDYPPIFELSHFISIFNISGLKDLNNNLYNEDTLYFEISNNKTLNIDTQNELNIWNQQK